ncbi:hypothetical protein K432DRAFT_438839 [Lepidopterella palustris CBS 459.81]|uniref:C2H2-type domain-containing protein n=1 Tax=Lepidopterella palustris CBS 459.81 TaxID=1314670 RepID=A0A8E2EL94_9PEZI|nr:hypothetical protein K432DRAFT_438839 [Lepidopterella palustris CBS 459.81]
MIPDFATGQADGHSSRNDSSSETYLGVSQLLLSGTVGAHLPPVWSPLGQCIDSSKYVMPTPENVQAANRACEEKRRRSSVASALSRARRRERENQVLASIAVLEEDVEFYRRERDYLAQLTDTALGPGARYFRPPSPCRGRPPVPVSDLSSIVRKLEAKTQRMEIAMQKHEEDLQAFAEIHSGGAESYLAISRNRSCIEQRQRPQVRDHTYGCTFPRCWRTFETGDVWKAHEKGHFYPEAWSCPDCLKLCFRRERFVEHLTVHHWIIDEAIITSRCTYQRVTYDHDDSYWCGFCRTILQGSSMSSMPFGRQVEDRFQHINAHFELGLRIDQWYCLETRRIKGSTAIDSSEVHELPNYKSLAQGGHGDNSQSTTGDGSGGQKRKIRESDDSG